MTRAYSSPEAFKQALEQRLRASSRSGAEFARKRQLLVFERFLARVVDALGDTATLKGGLVLELRLDRARTTKDVDLRVVGAPDNVLAQLQDAAKRRSPDFMTFAVRPDDEHPAIQNDGMQYDGLRFRAECTLAGRLYGQSFGVDVAFGDPMLGEPDLVVAEDVLAFLQALPRRRSASIPSRPISPKSFMRTRCRARDPTRGSRISPISRCSRQCSR